MPLPLDDIFHQNGWSQFTAYLTVLLEDDQSAITRRCRFHVLHVPRYGMFGEHLLELVPEALVMFLYHREMRHSIPDMA